MQGKRRKHTTTHLQLGQLGGVLPLAMLLLLPKLGQLLPQVPPNVLNPCLSLPSRLGSPLLGLGLRSRQRLGCLPPRGRLTLRRERGRLVRKARLSPPLRRRGLRLPQRLCLPLLLGGRCFQLLLLLLSPLHGLSQPLRRSGSGLQQRLGLPLLSHGIGLPQGLGLPAARQLLGFGRPLLPRGQQFRLAACDAVPAGAGAEARG